MRIISAVMLATLALTAACGEKKDVKETVFGSQVQMKDKARAVEDRLREGADKNRDAIKTSEQGGGAGQQ